MNLFNLFTETVYVTPVNMLAVFLALVMLMVLAYLLGTWLGYYRFQRRVVYTVRTYTHNDYNLFIALLVRFILDNGYFPSGEDIQPLLARQRRYGDTVKGEPSVSTH